MVDQLGKASIKIKDSLSLSSINIHNFGLVRKTGEPLPFQCWGTHWLFLLHALWRQRQLGWVHKGSSPDVYKWNVFLQFSGSLALRDFLSHCLWLPPSLGYEVWCGCRSSGWACHGNPFSFTNCDFLCSLPSTTHRNFSAEVWDLHWSTLKRHRWYCVHLQNINSRFTLKSLRFPNMYSASQNLFACFANNKEIHWDSQKCWGINQY